MNDQDSASKGNSVDSTQYLIVVVVVAALITYALRAIPFAVSAPLQKSGLMRYLADRMPVGVLVILTVYTIRDVDVLDLASVIPVAAGLLVTAGLHLWRDSMLLSIAGGTATYVLLMSANLLPA